MVDFLKKEKKLKVNTIKETYLTPKYIFDIGAFLASSTWFSFCNALDGTNKDKIALSLMGITAIKSMYDFLKSEESRDIDRDFIIQNMLAETETYEKLTDLYSEYIYNLQDYINYLDIISSKCICGIYKELLDNGILSVTGKNNIKEYKYYKGDLPELRGAKVLTGEITSFEASDLLVNILNASNHESCNIMVKINKHLINHDRVMNNKMSYCESVVGIIDDNGKYLYDPINGVYLNGFRDNLVASSIHPEFKTYYYIDEYQEDLNPHFLPEAKKFLESRYKIMPVTKKEEEDLEYKKLFKKHKDRFIRFRMKNLILMEEIVRLSEKLSPRSDSKILKWKVK